jgi:hypothetical protein
VAPPGTGRAPPPPSTPPAKAPVRDAPLDETLTFAAQAGGAAGLGALLIFPAYMLNAMTCGLGNCVIIPTAMALGVTWLGDVFGPDRAALLYPWLAAVATGAMSSVAFFAGAFWIVIMSSAGAAGGAAIVLPGFVMLGAGALCGPAASGIAAAGAYWATKEPKGPEDDGSGLPGLTEPAHQGPRPAPVEGANERRGDEPPPAERERALPSPPLSVMAF